jgi:peptidase E
VEYHRFVGDGMRGGYAADDGAALHFAGTELRDVVTSRRGRRAYRVDVEGHDVIETPLEARYLGLDEPALSAA